MNVDCNHLLKICLLPGAEASDIFEDGKHLIIVEGNAIGNLEGTTFYINSSEHLIQASSANKMSVKERVVPYESKTLQVSIN